MSEIKNTCGYCGEIIEDVYSAGWVVGKNEVYHYSCSKRVANTMYNKNDGSFIVSYTKEIFDLLSSDDKIKILSISGSSEADTIITYKIL